MRKREREKGETEDREGEEEIDRNIDWVRGARENTCEKYQQKEKWR